MEFDRGSLSQREAGKKTAPCKQMFLSHAVTGANWTLAAKGNFFFFIKSAMSVFCTVHSRPHLSHWACPFGMHMEEVLLL